MRQLCISFAAVFLGSAPRLMQRAKPKPAPVRDGGYWVRTSKADRCFRRQGCGWKLPATSKCAARRSDRATYALKLRVKPGTRAKPKRCCASYREDRNRGRLGLSQGNSAPAGFRGLELTVTGPRALRRRVGRNARRQCASVRLGRRIWKLDRPAAGSRWMAFGAAANCGPPEATSKWAT
jgi:hypothetical protein